MTYQLRPDASGDTLVATRNPIRNNFEIIQNRFQDNHTDFDSGTGKHKWVEMPDQAVIPAGLDPLEGTLYVKVANGRSQLFYTNENSNNEYQLTRTNNADFTTFGTNTVYSAGFNGGWTFLPGGMLLQYGLTVGNATDNSTIPFPKTFTNVPLSVTAVFFSNAASQATVRVFNWTTTGFDIRVSDARRVSWMAIGV